MINRPRVPEAMLRSLSEHSDPKVREAATQALERAGLPISEQQGASDPLATQEGRSKWWDEMVASRGSHTEDAAWALVRDGFKGDLHDLLAVVGSERQ